MLSEPWIDRVMSRLAVRYGSAWTRQWAGLDPRAVKADWAHELGGLAEWPEAIAHALAHLPPERPPTVAQFLDVARRGPPRAVPQLPAPESDPQRVAEALQQLGKQRGALRGRAGGMAWALDLKRREQAGEPLTIYQRESWRAALGEDKPCA